MLLEVDKTNRHMHGGGAKRECKTSFLRVWARNPAGVCKVVKLTSQELGNARIKQPAQPQFGSLCTLDVMHPLII